MKSFGASVVATLVFAASFVSTANAQSIDAYFYDPSLGGLSDVTIPGTRVSLHMRLNASAVIKSGEITVSLPQEFTYNGDWQWRNGSVVDVSGSDSTITVDLDAEDAAGAATSAVGVWFSLSVASVKDLPPTAGMQTIQFSANLETS